MSGARAGARGPGGVARQHLARVEAADVRERFLKAILAKVALERIVEVHLFEPIRQGGQESGVALVAVELVAVEPDSAPGETEGPSAERRAPSRDVRHTICTARYRLTLRGMDRGKWEFDLVEEADAPLDAVDAVIRGVQHRSSEGSESERLSGDELRALTADPAWTSAR